MRKGKLGQMLVDAELVSEEQLRKAEDMQKILGGKLGAVIVKLGFVSDEDLTRFLAKKENLPIVDLSQIVVPGTLVQSVSREVLESHQVIPVRQKGGVLTLAMSDPTDFEAIEEIQFLANCRVEIAMASRAQIGKALNELFYGDGAGTPPKPEAADTPPVVEKPAPAAEIDPELVKALIPLLVDKGLITVEELEEKARTLVKGKE